MIPKVSVIIPVYNVEKWIRECLDSVCGHSLREIEIVCVNDGSPDNSLEILNEYAARDERIVIIDKKNEGVGAARNDGIRAATGEYVAFMDPDDKYLDADSLRILYEAAIENHVMIAGGYFGCINGRSERVPKSRSYYGVDFSCEGLIQYKDFQCDYQFQAYIYRREFLIRNDLCFPTYARFQDPPFFVNAMCTAGQFYAVNAMTYLYRAGLSNPKFSYKKAFDLLCGISDNLRVSRGKGFARLHYITAMRFLTDATAVTDRLKGDSNYKELLWKYIKTAGLIDEDLISGGGYSLPEPILPKVFIHLLEDSENYNKLMQHRSVRAYEKIFVRN